MKILIKNFGPIHEFEFDLEKDLHVIYGENSIGKSYSVCCVYQILKTLKNYHFGYLFQYEENMNILHKNSLYFLENKEGNFNVINEFSEILKNILQVSFIPLLKGALINTFFSIESLPNGYSKENATIKISSDRILLDINIVGKELQINSLLIYDKYLVKVKQGKQSNFDYSFYFNDEIFFTESNIDNFTKHLISSVGSQISDLFRISSLPNYYFLPSSRSGLYHSLGALSPILATIAQNRFMLKQSTIQLPALAEPVADYFLDIASVDTTYKSLKTKLIAEKIEKSLLHGRVKFDKKTKKIIFFPDNTNLGIDIKLTSSMVSEIAPLVIFLKHIIGKQRYGNMELPLLNFASKSDIKKALFEDRGIPLILFIEEPEAHLHPKIQVQLMEIFAELTKVGVKVVMTTHSNYMFNKLSNMLLKKEIEVDKVGSYHLVMTDKGSVVNPDMQATEEGMEDHNFVDTAEELYNERLLAYETLNTTTH